MWMPGEMQKSLASTALSTTVGEVRCLSIDTRVDLRQIDPGLSMRFCAGTDKGFVVECHMDARHAALMANYKWMAHPRAVSSGAVFSGVVSIAFHGGDIVTGGSDSAAAIWHDNEESGFQRARHLPAAHGGAVTAVAAASPLAQAFTAGQDGAVRVWSEQGDTSLPVHSRDASNSASVNSIVHDAKHHRLCTASEDGLLRLWDVASCQATRRFVAGRSTRCPGSPVDEITGVRRVMSPGENPQLHRRGAGAVAFDTVETPSQLASGGSDGSWRMWDIREEQHAVERQKAHISGIASVEVLGDRLLSASVDGDVALWDLRNPEAPLESVDLSLLRPVSMHMPWSASRTASSSGPDLHYKLAH